MGENGYWSGVHGERERPAEKAKWGVVVPAGWRIILLVTAHTLQRLFPSYSQYPTPESGGTPRRQIFGILPHQHTTPLRTACCNLLAQRPSQQACHRRISQQRCTSPPHPHLPRSAPGPRYKPAEARGFPFSSPRAFTHQGLTGHPHWILAQRPASGPCCCSLQIAVHKVAHILRVAVPPTSPPPALPGSMWGALPVLMRRSSQIALVVG